jgi:hypothetical protein
MMGVQALRCAQFTNCLNGPRQNDDKSIRASRVLKNYDEPSLVSVRSGALGWHLDGAH